MRAEATNIVFPVMGTIKEAAAVSGLTVYRIRILCREGTVKSLRCGKRILVNLSSLADYMNAGEPVSCDVQPSPVHGIRRIG